VRRIAKRMRGVRRSLRKRLLRAWTWLWRRLMLRTTVVAITGSVGKTTAKECLAAVLEPHGPTLKTFQNQNDQVGVPRTIRRMRPWHRFAVVEVATSGPGSVRRSGRLLRPDVAVVLSVARTHTDRFRDLDAIADEKAALARCVRPGGLVLLNGDDPRLRGLAGRLRTPTRLFGRAGDCHVRASRVESRWPACLELEATTPAGRARLRTRLVGTHWVPSVLAAVAAGEACGVSVREAAPRIGAVAPVPARMQPVWLPNGACFVRDEGNGSGDSLRAMLDVLRDAQAPRRGIVFSEQSDDRRSPRKRQRDVGRLAAAHCDFAVFVGEHAHHARRAAVGAGMAPEACVEFVRLQDAAAWLRRSLREGDLVFLKGRTTDHLSRLLFAQLVDVDCWKSWCRITRLCDFCGALAPGADLEAILAAPGRRTPPRAGPPA